MFSCEICEIFQSTFFEEHLQTNTSVYLLEEKIMKEFLAKSLAVFTIKVILFTCDSENLPAFSLREKCPYP